MEFIYLLIGVIIGAAGGFFARKQMSASEQEFKHLQQEVTESKTSLEQYQNEVATHLQNSTNLLAKMNDACKTAMIQMEQSTQLLDRANQRSNEMPFFSAETEAHIRSNPLPKKAKRGVRNEALTEPPRDYSDDPSGIFSDAQQVVTNKAS
ncbi:DUF1043 family protein [Thalassotalea sp. Y01]|uniref:YhcB family protein n=1 Tax=Thalassotalea sp. Y01 TaxID=2729613 RepID=UPI00145E6784|nr:DUF1043 family protein [Thalassotalea sp. Y01]NMP15740.1 YhcB family protein [Thalassotalea sp. Y01]